ncbi:MAG TPA: DEAD/DEAH box helicase family protein [Nitrolancea sp.]
MSAQPSLDLPMRFARATFRWPFRRYQSLALDAYEGNGARDDRRCYLVMPPGAGKTAVGLEIARRRGLPTLVLCPNTAVQAQWLRQWRDFQPATVEASPATDLSAPLTVLTYQAICNVDRDDPDLEEQAHALWREELQREDGLSVEEAEHKIDTLAWAQAESHQYQDAMRGYRRQLRGEVLRDGETDDLLDLLHPNGRAIIDRMSASGPWTLVLDECHHLLRMWGTLLRAIIARLDPASLVVGLTATPPGDMDAHEAALYQEIFGSADFEVPTPAVVKEGDLAPYQELVYVTQPLPHKLDFIGTQHERFEELLTQLMDVDFASRPFLDWLRTRVVERKGRNGAQLSWARFERDEPALARAALRFFWQKQIELPEGARLGERERQPPTADDWVALIDDYCKTLRDRVDPRDISAWQTIREALPSLGYTLTRQGIRSYVSPVDRVLSLSASKAVAALAILDAEQAALGANLRALILCDYERAGREMLAKLRGVLDPQAGSAALLLHQLASSPSVAQLDPLLVTGRTVACSRATASRLLPWIEQQVPELRGLLATDTLFRPPGDDIAGSWDDLVTIRPEHGWWRPRNYVPLLTTYFEEGHSACLIGTRGLLGEGWDAKRINVLLDLTAASTSTSVHQMRGRSLRLDPALPHKVANNWDVVCVDPSHPKGAADYARFVRKHRDYYAPTLEGDIESGVSHVHPALSPYGPPPATEFEPINVTMLHRAGARDAAYARWRIGEPYQNAETHTVRVHIGRPIGLPNRQLYAQTGGTVGLQRRALVLVGSAGVAGIAVAAAGPDLLGLAGGLALLGGGGAWLSRSLEQAIARSQPSGALEDFAATVAEALAATSGISRNLGPANVRVVAQEDGQYRCFLDGATTEESARFAEAIDQLLSPLAAPRYIIPRYVVSRPASLLQSAALALRLSIGRTRGRTVVYHTVPDWLAANRERTDAFARAWNRYVSAGEPLYWKDPAAQAILAAQRGDDLFDVTTQMRVLWR